MIEIIKFLGGTTIVISAVAWLIRSLASHLLSKDIEKFKSELLIQSIEHEQKLSRLLDKRAEVISELYKKLIEFISEAESFSHPVAYSGEPSKKEKYESFTVAARDFRIYFNQNRIYFSKSFCEKVDSLWRKIFDPTRRFAFWLNRDEEGFNPKTQEAWDKAWDTISDVVPQLLSTLQDDFREILGVENKI